MKNHYAMKIYLCLSLIIDLDFVEVKVSLVK